MRQKWVYGALFPVNGSKNSSVEIKAIQEMDGTWTARVAQVVNGVTAKATLFGGFASLFEALRTANQIGLGMAEQQHGGNHRRIAPPTPQHGFGQGVHYD
jgi:hypothetical protein